MSCVIIKALAKPCSKRRLLICRIQMADVAKLLCTEYCRALLAFLCDKCSYGCGQCYKIVPQHHRRASENMRKNNTFNTKMAKQNYRIVVWINNLKMIVFMYIAVLFKKLVNSFANLFVSFFNISALHQIGFQPSLRYVKIRVIGPLTRKLIPCSL